jgi:hypothetical protein
MDIDYGAAYSYFKKGWDAGNKNCQAHIGWMTTIGQGVPSTNVIEGMKLLKSAEEESAEAQNYLGFCALEGISMFPISFIRNNVRPKIEPVISLRLFFQGRAKRARRGFIKFGLYVSTRKGHFPIHLGGRQIFHTSGRARESFGSSAFGNDVPRRRWSEEKCT